MSSSLSLHEVTARDGIQNESLVLQTKEKYELVKKLIAFRPRSIEVASFVRGDLVPTQAGSNDLCSMLLDAQEVRDFKNEGGSLSALVPNMRGLQQVRR